MRGAYFLVKCQLLLTSPLVCEAFAPSSWSSSGSSSWSSLPLEGRVVRGRKDYCWKEPWVGWSRENDGDEGACGRRRSCLAFSQRPSPFFMEDVEEDYSFDGGPANAPNNAPNDSKDINDVPNSSSSPGISSVDARVLESILNEGKLDVSTEEEVKKLLKGPREKIPGDNQGDVQSEYSSKFVNTISDNSFWNSLKAKANELLDSVQIYIENRIDRDTQLLASVGLFAWDRIQRDTARALPAAGRQVRKVQRLLAEQSQRPDGAQDTIEEEPFGEQSVYDELSTPADEIKRVTESIRDILAGKEVLVGGALLPPPRSSRRAPRGAGALRSLAPAGTSRLLERQKRSYQSRKATLARKEPRRLDQAVSRTVGSLASSVADTAWEWKREVQMMDAGGIEAGYRSEGVRKVLRESVGGFTKLIGKGKDAWLLQGTVNAKNLPSAATDTPETVLDVTIESATAQSQAPIPFQMPQLEYAPDGLLSPSSFLEEKTRLASCLEQCLTSPSQTWLTKQVVTKSTQSGVALDGTMLREVIATMVCARDELHRELDLLNQPNDQSNQSILTIQYVTRELKRMKSMVDSISSLASSAAGPEAAALLRTQLEGFLLSETLDEIIDTERRRMDDLEKEMAMDMAEAALLSQMEDDHHEDADPIMNKMRDPIMNPIMHETTDDTRTDPVTAAEVIVTNSPDPNEAEPFVTAEFVSTSKDTTTNVVVESTHRRDAQINQGTQGATVEVLTENDLQQDFKSAYSVEEEQEESENVVGKFILRTVDAIFFIAEKFFLVLLPSIIATGTNISTRYNQAQTRGNGSPGWQLLTNIQSKKRQY